MPPVVGIVCDTETKDGMISQRVGEEYVAAVRDGVGALPLLIPAVMQPDVDGILGKVDGLLFSGAPSNVAPELYGGPAARAGTASDAARDATTLPLLRAAIARGLPVLCICRGFQELNVALGGTLDPHVHETPGRLDHREDESAPPAVQYGPAHGVMIAPGGVLAGLLDAKEVMVNSLHHQGVARLAPGLFAEAHAPDGLVEAVSRPGGGGFLLGVQWHPEWAWDRDPVSRAIFGAFRAAIDSRPQDYGKNGADKGKIR